MSAAVDVMTAATASLSIENLISLSFDNYQKNGEDDELVQANHRVSTTTSSTSFLLQNPAATANDLRLQIYNYLVDVDNEEDGEEEVILTIIQILKSTLANLASSSSSLTTYNSFKSSEVSESTFKVLDMVANFVFAKGDGRLAEQVLDFLLPFSSVEVECIRGIICDFMGMALGYLFNGAGISNSNIGNAKKMKKKSQLLKIYNIPFLFGFKDEAEEFSWREDITTSIKDVLTQRLQDKSQAVRLLAIQATGQLFNSISISTSTTANVNEQQDILGLSNVELHEEITEALLWNLNHDPSFANRSAAINSLPITVDTLPSIVSRTRDSKLKVRVEALDLLSQKVDVKRLTRQQRVEILQSGLSTRYPATYQAATKMLCCGWMKSVKFDPVLLLELLEATTTYSSSSVEGGGEGLDESAVFEEVSVNAARAIIAAASEDYHSGVAVDDHGGNNNGKGGQVSGSLAVISTSELTLAALSNPEIREYKENVLDLKRFNMNTMYKSCGEPGERNENDDLDGSCTGQLTAASILFIRTMCDMIMESKSLTDYKKSTLLADIVPDVIILGEVIGHHMEKLIAIQMELDELDEDDHRVVEYEAKEDNEVFICLHLLKLSKVVDMNEEGTRRHFSNIIHRILCNPDTHADLVDGAVVALSASHHSEAGFLLSISEVLSHVIETDNEDHEQDNEDVEDSVPTAPVNPEMKKEQYLRGIEILSVALEKTSRKMSSNAVLQNFASVILTAITDLSLGPLVREAGVSCFGRYVILMEESTIMSKYKPILMGIAFSEEEKIEIRAQATLAICDLAFMFHRIMAPILLENVSDTEVSLSDLLYKLLSQPRKSLAIVAAECAAKLLFTGKMHDANVVAHLVAMYFDKDLAGSLEEGNESVKGVGSPTRLAQLLTIFFPAYSMGSAIGRETLSACNKPLLRVVHEKMSVKVKGRRSTTWPIAKMIQYVCQTIEGGEEAAQAVEKCEREEEPKGASPLLNAVNAICSFINEDGDELTTAYLRALCKILSNSYIDVESEDICALRSLKQGLNDLAINVTDTTAMRSLENLIELVDEVNSDDEDDVDDIEENNGDEAVDAEEVNSDDEDDANEIEESNGDEAANVEEVDSDDEDDESNADETNEQSYIEMEESEEMNEEVQNTTAEKPAFANVGQNERNRKSNSSSRTNKSRTLNGNGIPSFASLGTAADSEQTSSTSRTAGGPKDGIPMFASIGSSDARTIREQKRALDNSQSGSDSESESDSSSSSSDSDEYSD